MHGTGTKKGIIPNNVPPARLLDVTRLLRRFGRPLTGVDRVEQAYLRYFLTDSVAIYGLIRTSLGYLLLDRAGLDLLDQALCVGPLCDHNHAGPVKKITQKLRKCAIARGLPFRLQAMLKKNLPPKTSYVNVGHSNITRRVFQSLKHGIDAKISVMIHDIIPIEHPQFQRQKTLQPFVNKIKYIQNHADLIIFNSYDTRRKTTKYLQETGREPPSVVSHLGVNPVEPDPSFETPAPPYFVYVSTIEPRKNHAFLLDLWEKMGADAPLLFFCGTRGWNNAEVFERLDHLDETHPVKECSGLTDAQIAALLKGACGALFPSLSEGYGFPTLEAAALGVPVLCNDLEVLRETLGDFPIYVDVNDCYSWLKEIERLTQEKVNIRNRECLSPPTWDAHFNAINHLV